MWQCWWLEGAWSACCDSGSIIMSRTIPSLSVHPARIDKGAWGGAETGKLLGLKLVIAGLLQGAVPPVAQAPR